MNEIFVLIDKLIALAAPTLVSIQAALNMVLTPAAAPHDLWRFYEARPTSGVVATVDLRVPQANASGNAPFLVLELRRGQVRLDDLRQRYGTPKPSDVSAHHPGILGYTFATGGVPIAINVDSKTSEVLAIAIDYSQAPAAKGSAR